MNERIQELKHQAFLWCDENIPEQYSHETGYGDAWEDKFAELIVRECIKEIGYKSADLLDIDFYPHYQERLKKRFGVKE